MQKAEAVHGWLASPQVGLYMGHVNPNKRKLGYWDCHPSFYIAAACRIKFLGKHDIHIYNLLKP